MFTKKGYKILGGYGYLKIILISIPFGSMCHARTFTRELNRPSVNII